MTINNKFINKQRETNKVHNKSHVYYVYHKI